MALLYTTPHKYSTPSSFPHPRKSLQVCACKPGPQAHDSQCVTGPTDNGHSSQSHPPTRPTFLPAHKITQKTTRTGDTKLTKYWLSYTAKAKLCAASNGSATTLALETRGQPITNPPWRIYCATGSEIPLPSQIQTPILPIRLPSTSTVAQLFASVHPWHLKGTTKEASKSPW